MLITERIDQINHLKVMGRTTKRRDPLTLFWTGSGIELNFKGSELWIEWESDYAIHEPWYTVLCNDSFLSRQMVTKGKQWICILRNMNPEVVKNIKIIKEVQAMSDDEQHCLQIHQLRHDGQWMPIADKPLKIEFIGDSITSGEGAMGAVVEEDWISMWFSAVNNYTALTAKGMNADYRVLSQSGWGVISAWNNQPTCAMPPIYEKVCGLLKSEKNIQLGAGEINDFASWQPDFVVINLGTNDAGAFVQPPWTDPVTGISYKLRTEEDGSYHSEDLARLKKAMVDFIIKVRHYNPNAYILWVYGMLGTVLLETVFEVVDTYKNLTKDQQVTALQLPEMTAEGTGARWHPGIIAHQAAANHLIQTLTQIKSSHIE